MVVSFDVAAVRGVFPGLARRAGERAAVFFDGPAGSQVPQPVVDAMTRYLLRDNANHGGAFVTSRATDAMVHGARQALADFTGAADPEEIVFGANMTTLTFHLARQLARTWRPGDEIVVTASDHDANVTPWVLAAHGAGCSVQSIAVRPDTTLDLADARRRINGRTRLVALGAASNLSGTIHPVAQLAALAHDRGALVFVDAVHAAPHLRTDVKAIGADFLACSAYKRFGPHVGVLWGKRALLEELAADKVTPAPDHGADKWQTGTANFEGIAGAHAAVDYLAALGGTTAVTTAGTTAGTAGGTAGGTAAGTAGGTGRARALDDAFAAIERHERVLCTRLLAGLAELRGVTVIGITDPARAHERCPTVSFTARSRSPQQLAVALAERGVHCWAGNSYAVALTRALGLEPHGVLRLGLLHYNTEEEVDYVLSLLRELV